MCVRDQKVVRSRPNSPVEILLEVMYKEFRLGEILTPGGARSCSGCDLDHSLIVLSQSGSGAAPKIHKRIINDISTIITMQKHSCERRH